MNRIGFRLFIGDNNYNYSINIIIVIATNNGLRKN